MTRAKRLQVLGPVDAYVRALLDAGVRDLIVGYDAGREVYILPAIEEAHEEGEERFDQDDWLVYEVSCGLPGNRVTSWDYDTYAEAKEGFAEKCKDVDEYRARRKLGS